MDLVALRQLIDGDPALSAMREAGRDADVAAALAVRNNRGPVPITELSAYCVQAGVIGACEVAARSAAAPDSLKGLCFTVLSLLRDDWRLTTADVDDPQFGAACAGLIAAGLMTQQQCDDLTAMGANRRSRGEVLFGRAVTANDVSAAYGRV